MFPDGILSHAMRRPPAEGMARKSAPSSQFQTRTVPRMSTPAKYSPLPQKKSRCMTFPRLESVQSLSPPSFQIWIAPSRPLLANIFFHAAMAVTAPLWAWVAEHSSQPGHFHEHRVPSPPPVMRRFASSEKTMLVTGPECPFSVVIGTLSPARISHITPSSVPNTSAVLSALKERQVIVPNAAFPVLVSVPSGSDHWHKEPP
ncbi:MAG: hypothetical protein A4E42_00717 [Methanoregulaceae archaeon PtaU1.Bin222]|nr:MAG: hypothetical protein A4E42_00717 [Methanoregulaceae archaeon PtaU1.Bin222]